jgi:alpha-L-fucosidase
MKVPSVASVVCAVSIVFVLSLFSCGSTGDMPPPAMDTPETVEIADGPFSPDWESLTEYRCPEWFRDAKLGFWGIMGPQSVPEFGDWYARHMYIEGHDQYAHHVEHYGHPSEFGYKDIARLWKAEHFDPDRLMALYKRAGAKYFVVLANHHDNWDNWDSKYHAWNSVNVGPKKDIVGLWQKAAQKQGLRFGVTEHLARSFSWFNTNKGADTEGPYAGVPYDGNNPAYVDLYYPNHDEAHSSYPVNPPDWWVREWFYRTRDLIDTYKPDLVYTDGSVPYGEVGRNLIAHYYNANMGWHGGSLEAIYALKDWSHRTDLGEYVDGIGVQDVERGVLQEIKEAPWQTDTCIGDWYYRTGIDYKSPRLVLSLLADIVSKNGNLLLNIPLKHDGTIDAEEERILDEMGDWIAVNGEAIYGTRPWDVFGEGPSRIGNGHFGEREFGDMTARDIRFTTKGGDLYAIFMDWPESGVLRVTSLAGTGDGSENAVSGVRLLGHTGALEYAQDSAALSITLPAERPCDHVYAVRISGENLRAAGVSAH